MHAPYVIVSLALVAAGPHSLHAAGIPEPSLVMYGVVRSGNVRVTSGDLVWRFQGQGRTFDLSTSLTNINDQFCYVLRIPCETEIGSFLASTNSLKLTPTALAYARSNVTVWLDAPHQASFVASDQTSFTVSTRDRGRIERVDLLLSLPSTDSDGNGLPDWWERQFGLNDPNADSDDDGLSNFGEYKAGTNPNDPNSRFAFINAAAHPEGGVLVEWSSVDGLFYSLQRSSDLLAGFTNLLINIPATAPRNVHRDASAVGQGPYFYRLQVE